MHNGGQNRRVNGGQNGGMNGVNGGLNVRVNGGQNGGFNGGYNGQNRNNSGLIGLDWYCHTARAERVGGGLGGPCPGWRARLTRLSGGLAWLASLSD